MKCKKCGSKLELQDESGRWECPNCHAEFTFCPACQQLKEYEER